MSNKINIKFDGIVVRSSEGEANTVGLMNHNASKFLNWLGELESLGSEDIFVGKSADEICSLTFVEDESPYAAFLEPALAGRIGMRVVNINITYEEFLSMKPELEADDAAIEVEENIMSDTDKNNDNGYVFDYAVYVGRNVIGLSNEGSRTYLALDGKVARMKKSYAVKPGFEGNKPLLRFFSENSACFIDSTNHLKRITITEEELDRVKDLLNPFIEKSLYAAEPSMFPVYDQQLRLFDYVVIDEHGVVSGLADEADKTLILTPGGNVICSKTNNLTFASIGEPVSLKVSDDGVVYYDTAPKGHPLHEYNTRFIMSASKSKFEKAFKLLDNDGKLEEANSFTFGCLVVSGCGDKIGFTNNGAEYILLMNGEIKKLEEAIKEYAGNVYTDHGLFGDGYTIVFNPENNSSGVVNLPRETHQYVNIPISWNDLKEKRELFVPKYPFLGSPLNYMHFPMFPHQHPSAGLVSPTGQQMLCNPPMFQPHAGGNFDLRDVQMTKPSNNTNASNTKVFNGDHDGYVSEEAAKAIFGDKRFAGFYADSNGVEDPAPSSSIKPEIRGFDHDYDGVEVPTPSEEDIEEVRKAIASEVDKPAHSDLVALNKLTRKLVNCEDLYRIRGYKSTEDGNIVPDVSPVGYVAEHDETGELEVYTHSGFRLVVGKPSDITVDNLYVIK